MEGGSRIHRIRLAALAHCFSRRFRCVASTYPNVVSYVSSAAERLTLRSASILTRLADVVGSLIEVPVALSRIPFAVCVEPDAGRTSRMVSRATGL